jgi:hypothetical protein
MVKKRAKQTESHPVGKAPSTSNKETFQRLQLAALARSLKPVEGLQLKQATLADIAQFGLDVINARIQRKIGVDDMVGFKSICEILLKTLQPPQEQGGADKTGIITDFISTLPAGLQNAIAAHGREQAKLEQVAV